MRALSLPLRAAPGVVASLCLSLPHSNSICAVKTVAPSQFDLVLREIVRHGWLLLSDPKLPSVCSLITGEFISGSWWSHGRAHSIFQVNEQLADHRDVLITKLISTKVTFVHRTLWSEIMAIGEARDAWQVHEISPSALALLKIIDARQSLQTNQIKWPGSRQSKIGEATRELEKRLLIHSEEFHTESGAHAKLVETWRQWSRRTGFQPQRISPRAAKEKLEESVVALNKAFSARARLPWDIARKTRSSSE